MKHLINFLGMTAIAGIGHLVWVWSDAPMISLAVSTALGYLFGSVVTKIEEETKKNS